MVIGRKSAGCESSPRIGHRAPTWALALIAIWLGWFAPSASAATFAACDAWSLSGYLSFEPGSPLAGQPITVTAGRIAFIPQSAAISVQGNVIDVTLTGGFIDYIPPPPVCISVVIGALPAGSYTVNLRAFDPALVPPGAVFLTSKTLIVGSPASFAACNTASAPAGYIAVSPVVPTDSTPVTITVGQYSYVPESVAVVVQGNTIDVTLSATNVGFQPSPPTGCLSSVVGPLAPGDYTIALRLFDPLAPQSGAIFLTSTTLSVASPPDALSGLWWNASESGWGISLTQRRNIVFAAWFAYDDAGNPKWYTAPRCALAASGTSGSCIDTLYEVTGPTFFGAVFDPASARVSAVGTMSLNFTDSNSGAMSYAIGSRSRTVAITRQPITGGITPPAVNYTDLWWDPAESGWGVSITQQFSTMFIAWYVYDGSGRPVWYVASNCAVRSSNDGCTGTLYSTVGPEMGPSFDSSRVRSAPVGTVTLNFASPNRATLEYVVHGFKATKTITRQFF